MAAGKPVPTKAAATRQRTKDAIMRIAFQETRDTIAHCMGTVRGRQQAVSSGDKEIGQIWLPTAFPAAAAGRLSLLPTAHFRYIAPGISP